MVLGFNARNSTRDVDAFIQIPREARIVRQYARQIAEEDRENTQDQAGDGHAFVLAFGRDGRNRRACTAQAGTEFGKLRERLPAGGTVRFDERLRVGATALPEIVMLLSTGLEWLL